MLTSFFVVLIGTAAPVGFTDATAACKYIESRPTGQLFEWTHGGISSCYAIENGCALADRAQQSAGISMRLSACTEWTTTETEMRIVPAPASPSPSGGKK